LRFETVIGRAADQAAARVADPAPSLKGKNRATGPTVYTITADWLRSPSTSSNPDLYTVTESGDIRRPDGTHVPNNWIRHGIDFIEETTSTLLLGDTGWIGTITNADTLLAALREQTRDHEPSDLYHLHADTTGLYLIPTTLDTSTIQITGVGVWKASKYSDGKACVEITMLTPLNHHSARAEG
jgi:hypothetical protein